ncbi:MAG: hypothetical protein WC223_11815 [Bacteroidales bacterium]|jgi:hypothetical protein
MERIWNYFFYSTWKLQILLGDLLFQKPIYFIILNIFPFLRKNEAKGLKEYKKVMNNKDYGFNIGFAFGFMFLTTMVIYSSICLYIVKLLNIEVGDTIYYYFIVVVALSYLTNYLLLYRSDAYKKYFDEFDKVNNKSLIYLSAVLFHLGIIGFGILSIHWTVGFNL